jgi:hypothetical protein
MGFNSVFNALIYASQSNYAITINYRFPALPLNHVPAMSFIPFGKLQVWAGGGCGISPRKLGEKERDTALFNSRTVRKKPVHTIQNTKIICSDILRFN